MPTRLTREQVEQAVAAYERTGGNRSEAARTMGIAPATLSHRLDVAEHEFGLTPKVIDSVNMLDDEPEESVTCRLGDETGAIDAVMKTVVDVEELLKTQNVDPNEYEVGDVQRKQWTVGIKGDSPKQDRKIWLHSVSVKLKRRPRPTPQEIFDDLAAKLAAYSPTYRKPKQWKGGDHLLVVSLADLHVGKLAWPKETGEAYDVSIARKIAAEKVEEIASRAEVFGIRQILYVCGNDLLHVDHADNTTTAGTRLDADGRWQRSYDMAYQISVGAIDRLRLIAPVDVAVVPGNHDKEKGWTLGKLIDVHYRLDETVNVDNAPTPRKYYRFGATLLGLDHGDKVKPEKLPATMAREAPIEWSQTWCREFLCGHLHKRSKMEWQPVNTHDSVCVRVLPSLCAPDAWHNEMGYGGVRASEAYLYHHDTAYAGHISVNVPPEMAA